MRKEKLSYQNLTETKNFEQDGQKFLAMTEDNEIMGKQEAEISRLVNYLHLELGYEPRDGRHEFEKDLTQSAFKWEKPTDQNIENFDKLVDSDEKNQSPPTDQPRIRPSSQPHIESKAEPDVSVLCDPNQKS